MRISIIYFLILVFAGCNNKQELTPQWFVKVSEESRLSSLNNKLYLIEQIITSEINLQTGAKRQTNESVVNSDKAVIRKAGKENNVNRIKLTNGNIAYTLVESFSSTEDCYQSLYKYCVERIDTDNHHTIYRLGKFERVKVLDFEVIQNELFIIKQPANGGDAYYLEKYKLE